MTGPTLSHTRRHVLRMLAERKSLSGATLAPHLEAIQGRKQPRPVRLASKYLRDLMRAGLCERIVGARNAPSTFVITDAGRARLEAGR